MLTLDVWDWMYWTDERLIWDMSHFDVDVIRVEPDRLWMPDIELYDRYGNLSKFVPVGVAESGVGSSIPARSHTFMEIDLEIISIVILLPSAESFKKGCCQFQAKVCARSTG